jgi:hypothetical protein
MTMLEPIDEEAIRERLRTYLSVFEKGDPETYADQFQFPAGIWGNGTWTGIPDREACLAAVAGYMQQVRDIGGERGAIHEMTIIELLPRVAINQLTYQRLDAGGQPVENVRANYVMLKGDDSQWRIAMVAGESSPVGDSGS